MEERLITFGEIAGLLEKRRKDTDKRDYGDVALFAGKKGMAGAAILAARAAFRSGAGLVHIATEVENFPILQMAIPEAICIDREEAMARIDSFDAVAFGPGVGVSEESEDLLKRVIKGRGAKTLLLDADGLNLLARNIDQLESLITNGTKIIR